MKQRVIYVRRINDLLEELAFGINAFLIMGTSSMLLACSSRFIHAEINGQMIAGNTIGLMLMFFLPIIAFLAVFIRKSGKDNGISASLLLTSAIAMSGITIIDGQSDPASYQLFGGSLSMALFILSAYMTATSPGKWRDPANMLLFLLGAMSVVFVTLITQL